MIGVSLSWIKQKIKATSASFSDLDKVANKLISRVSTDTRTIKEGDLFIALVGPNFDGHQYADIAIDKGASALIVSQPINANIPVLTVSDTRIALGLLGAAVKQKAKVKTVGITGSSGKTTVKEMVSSILSCCGSVLATKGNLNNDIGVPLTLLEIEEHHDFAVVEMGANHQGEIEYTANLVQPDVATIVNASPAHIEGFGSLFGVARAKSEMVKGLKKDAVAILNADSQFYDYWQSNTHTEQILSFSYESEKGDFHANNVFVNEQGCAEFELVTPIGNAAIKLRVPGIHNVGNAVLAAALAMSVGASIVDVRQGLFNMQSVSGRLSVKVVSDKVKVIDDTYNANVGSVKAALDLLASYKGFRVFVFGDMGELGDQAAMYHKQIGEYASDKDIDALISCGVLSAHASAAMHDKGMACKTKDEAYQSLMQLIGPLISTHWPHNTHSIAQTCAISERDDLLTAGELVPKMHLEVSPVTKVQEPIPITILVKGSRSAKMETLVSAILEFDFTQPEDSISESANGDGNQISKQNPLNRENK